MTARRCRSISAAVSGLPAAVVAHIDYTRTPLNWYLGKRYSRDKLPVFFPYGGTLSPDEVDQVVAPPLQGIKPPVLAQTGTMRTQIHPIETARQQLPIKRLPPQRPGHQQRRYASRQQRRHQLIIAGQLRHQQQRGQRRAQARHQQRRHSGNHENTRQGRWR